MLIFDTNFVCWRAFHTFPDLSFNSIKTGVLFGVFRDILTLIERFEPERCVFAFDYGRGLREDAYEGYKSTRKAKRESASPEEKAIYAEMQEQVTALRTEYLAELGFSNVCYRKGYEADDVIAAIVNQDAGRHDIVIVSGDEDLLQLLSPAVRVYSPNKKQLITAKGFTTEYNISPSQWVDVKSLAGCDTDDVIGLPGIGPKTAIKYLNGVLKGNSKAFATITKGNKVWRENRKVVELPYPGIGTFELKRDTNTNLKWNVLLEKLGMTSLQEQIGGPRRAKAARRSTRKGFTDGQGRSI